MYLTLLLETMSFLFLVHFWLCVSCMYLSSEAVTHHEQDKTVAQSVMHPLVVVTFVLGIWGCGWRDGPETVQLLKPQLLPGIHWNSFFVCITFF